MSDDRWLVFGFSDFFFLKLDNMVEVMGLSVDQE